MDQLVVVKVSDTSIQGIEDLSGRDVTVHEGSSYAEALDRAKVKGIRIKVAPETMQTFDLLQKVGRGEEKITVADSDLFAGVTAFAPDLIAVGMTRTPEREKRFSFSPPYQFGSELLIVPSKDKTTKGLSDLKDKTVSVRKSSNYYETLMTMKDSLGFKIALLPEDLETEDILTQVGAGRIAATVADSNIVQLELTYNNNIRSVGPLGDVVEIGWIMRRNQSELKNEDDGFMKKLYKGTLYNIMVNKYFKDPKSGRSDQKVSADRGRQLSPYDDLVKKHSRAHEMDWRLVTA